MSAISRAVTSLLIMAAPTYVMAAGTHKTTTLAPVVAASPCAAKSEADMLKDIRTLLKCPNAAPTDCPCAGNKQKKFDCPGPAVTLWASTGKKCINATSDKDSTWAKHTWPYPANTADNCQGSSGTGANWEPGSYDCTKVKVTPVTKPVTYKAHKFQQGFAGYNSNYNSESWCTQKSCYVDPCKCNMKDFSASSWFKNQDGSKMYYSGMKCGGKYTFKAALCKGSTTKVQCLKDTGCKWTAPAAGATATSDGKRTFELSALGLIMGATLL